MNTYEHLLAEADRLGLVTKEKPLSASNGRIAGNRIAIRKDIKTTTEKACVLAEELGHHYTSHGNIVDMDNIENRKQENKARFWAYNSRIGLLGLIKAYEYGCRNRHETAEYLDVTEEFLQETLDCYKGKYGLYTTVDNYIVYFDHNIGIAKMN